MVAKNTLTIRPVVRHHERGMLILGFKARFVYLAGVAMLSLVFGIVAQRGVDRLAHVPQIRAAMSHVPVAFIPPLDARLFGPGGGPTAPHGPGLGGPSRPVQLGPLARPAQPGQPGQPDRAGSLGRLGLLGPTEPSGSTGRNRGDWTERL